VSAEAPVALHAHATPRIATRRCLLRREARQIAISSIHRYGPTSTQAIVDGSGVVDVTLALLSDGVASVRN
jgi:hypothetical protein